MKKTKKGQVTIFIIIAVLIVALAIGFFVLRNQTGPKTIEAPEIGNPNSFLDSCMKEKIEDTKNILLNQGGYLKNPLSMRFKFGNEQSWNISYLCYTNSLWLPCDVSEPLLIRHVQKEMSEEISQDINSCFNELVTTLRGEGYIVDEDYKGFNLEIGPNGIEINIDADLNVFRDEQSTSQKEFEINYPTKLYDILLVSNEIVNQQAKYCSFNEIGYMSLYTDYEIEIQIAPNNTKIYSVEYESTNEKMRFAVRGCVPA